MDYAAALIGELRILEAFGVDRETPSAFTWKPKSAARWRAPNRTRIDTLGAPFSLSQIMKRVRREMVVGMRLVTEEYKWFDEVPA